MTINRKNWPEISRLLDNALEQPEEQRLEWLEQLQLDDKELEEQLRELLMAERILQDPLRKPPDFSAVLNEEAPHYKASIELQTGHVIGPYRLNRELGRGGMGAVWLAERVDGKYRREVALKFPYAGPHQRELAQRLMRERDILAGLQHANIARMYDADVTDSGQPFLVLEYVNGTAIHRYCDDKRLDLRARLTLFQQVMNAVRYAHEHAVIHRDLKPSNILITQDGVAHLLDFGIATLITDGEVHESPLTTMGGHLLTPEYASPEQVERIPVTPASDVYSLGVVLYELLTGVSPYPHTREEKAKLEQDIADAEVIAPSRAAITRNAAANRNSSPQQLRRNLRGELDTLLLKSLKKDIHERYASVDALHEDIRRYLAHQPILAQPGSQWYHIRKFAQRNRIVVASLAAIMIAMIAGTSIALWQARKAGIERDRAVASAARSQAVTDFLQLMMTDVGDADEPVTMQQLAARSEAIASSTYASDVNQQVAVLEVLGNYYLSFNRATDAARSFSNALKLADMTLDGAAKAELRCKYAAAEFQLGNFDSARQQMLAGINNGDLSPHSMMTCLRTRAYLEYQDADLQSALRDIKLAKEQLQASGVTDQTSVAGLMADAAQVYADLGQTSDADHEYAGAMALLNRIGRGESRDAMELQNSWAVNHDSNGDPRGALAHYDKAIEIAHKRGMGTRSGEMYAANRAYALHQLARNDEALAAYHLSIEMAKKNGNLYELLSAKQRMTAALLSLGRLDEAEHQINELNTMISKMPTRDDFTLQGMYALAGGLARKQKHNSEAIHNFTLNIDYLVAHKMQGGYLADSLNSRGETYLDTDQIELAMSDATKSYEMATKAQGDTPYSCITGDAASLLATIEAKRNQTRSANKWAAIAYQQLQGSLGDNHPKTIKARKLMEHLQSVLQ